MIKRESYLRRIRPFIGTDIVKVLTGIRRCGKSVMLSQIQEDLLAGGVARDHVIALNFESFSTLEFRTAERLHEEIRRRAAGLSGKVYLFFDEIQEVDGWEKCVNSLRVDLDCDITVTGSNSRLLSGELATYLAGRYVQFVIFPFSFAEFSELWRAARPGTDTSACFRQYLLTGGMPYLHSIGYEKELCRQYLLDLFSSVEIRDIVKRNSIRDVDMLERLIAYVTDNIGSTFSSQAISKYLKSEKRSVSTPTVMNYLKACTDAYLFHQIRREDLRGKKILAVNEKYYAADHGFKEALFGDNARDMNLVLENIVCVELLRRGYAVTVGKNGEKEIDFVCRKGSSLLYIQVTCWLSSEETVRREFGAFEGIRDHFPKLVVSLDDFDLSRNGIRHWNIRDFLLDPSWG